ncbi:MAG TPA: ABC transporter permease [Roseiflexaceae bacterium]|nr:ABC transporter permease [Roseiflexaceae bacterium]
MNLLEAVRIAWGALITNKLRALLTMLGIIIGVGAVVGLLAIGNGLAAYLEQEFGRLGVGVFYIGPEVDSDQTEQTQRPRLTYEDALALLEPGVAPAVRTIVAEVGGSVIIGARGSTDFIYQLKGVTPSNFAISANTLGAGRYYTDDEERTRARVALLGNDIAAELFGPDLAQAVGQRVTLNGVTFEVIGVLTTRASAVSGDFSTPGETVYVPYQSARAWLFRNRYTNRVNVDRITIQAATRTEVDAAISQTTAALRQRHRLTSQQANDFRIDNPEETARQAQASIVGLNAFLGIIAGISLLVGGIGIMNIMLVSVTQRTREIGLRKAVGARPRDILMQFLIEALVLCLCGGALGVALGASMSFVGTFVLQNVLLVDTQALITPGSIILATVVSATIGIFFGLFPAIRASRLNPIQALRYE